MMASVSATPMTIKGTLIDSTIFHTSDQLMESNVDVLFQVRNPASQSQISSLSIPICVSIDMGRRRPEGRWEPPPPIQPHGRPREAGLRAFCRIGRTICHALSPSPASRSAAQRAHHSPTSRLPQEPRPGIHRPRPCFQLARKPDNLRVNRFIRTQTRSLARGQRRPRAHLAVNVRINAPTCTSTPLRVLRRARSRMTD